MRAAERLHASGGHARRFVALTLLVCLSALGSCEEPSPQQRMENARAFLQGGNAQLAIAELKRVLQEQPDDAEVRVMLGKIYLTGGDLPYAEKELERAQALGLDSAELMVTLGELWLKQGRREHLLAELNAKDDWPQDARIALHELRARAFLDLDDVAGARRAYEAILGIDPNNVDARIDLVRLAMRADDPGAGELVLTDALHIAPDHPILLGLSGDLAFRRGAYADAIGHYRRQLQANPRSLAIRLSLAQALLAAGEYPQADALLDDLLAERPDNGLANYLRAVSAMHTGNAEAVQEHGERAVAALPDHVPSLFLLAASAYALSRFELAQAYLERVLAQAPDHTPAQRLLVAARGQLALSRSDAGDAALEIERRFRVDLTAVQGAEAEDQGGIDLAEVANAGRLARGGDQGAAAEVLARLEGAAPDSAAVLELRGGLALLAGRAQTAARAFEAAQHKAPAPALARKLALARWQAGERAGAEETLEAWLARNPGDLETQLTLADLQLAAGRPEMARRHLTRVVTARPDSVPALNNLAWALLQEGRAAAARPFAERALRLAPDEPRVLDTLALVLSELDQLDRAVALLQRAIRAETAGPAIEVHLAQALAARGDAEEARAILRRLLANPDLLATNQRVDAQALLHDLVPTLRSRDR
ncbi:MAG TPA: tetratricopeptide repeat protein [Geminicoccaceae bacterium]|nr:tetratricopeptide repeat protein [Geminicoccaceae bacterium]